MYANVDFLNQSTIVHKNEAIRGTVNSNKNTIHYFCIMYVTTLK